MKLRIVVLLLTIMFALHAQAINVHQLRSVAAKKNITCMLVFGDSSVDPGNNNHLTTSTKCNFKPYGEDFPNGRATGRFCNGRLATDFIAEAFGYTNIIRGFLDPYFSKMDLLHGVSFASAGSGYDDYTANISGVLAISRQLEYFKHYKIHLSQLVGGKDANVIIGNAMFILSMGTNDFLQNYFIEPLRSTQYTIQQYEDYLISSMVNHIKAMHSLGARRLIVVGVPPFGCMPLMRNIRGDTKSCDVDLNKVAFSFNLKIQKTLKTFQTSFSMSTVFADIYGVVQRAVQNPSRYGFTEALKGCCGSGTYEYGDTCRSLTTCNDRSKYVFWDAVHPTEKMYSIVADQVVASISTTMFP